MDNYTQTWLIHSNIILYAFDYCLGRYTYAGSEFIKNVKANQNALNEFMVDYMVRSIKAYLERVKPEQYSADVDSVHWQEFLQWLEELDLSAIEPVTYAKIRPATIRPPLYLDDE